MKDQFTSNQLISQRYSAFCPVHSALDAGVIEADGSAYLCIEQIDRLSRQSIDEAYQVFRKILKANVNVITLMDKKTYTKDRLNEYYVFVWYGLTFLDSF